MVYCESKIEVVITRVAVYDPAFVDLVNVLSGNQLGAREDQSLVIRNGGRVGMVVGSSMPHAAWIA